MTKFAILAATGGGTLAALNELRKKVIELEKDLASSNKKLQAVCEESVKTKEALNREIKSRKEELADIKMHMQKLEAYIREMQLLKDIWLFKVMTKAADPKSVSSSNTKDFMDMDQLLKAV